MPARAMNGRRVIAPRMGRSVDARAPHWVGSAWIEKERTDANPRAERPAMADYASPKARGVLPGPAKSAWAAEILDRHGPASARPSLRSGAWGPETVTRRSARPAAGSPQLEATTEAVAWTIRSRCRAGVRAAFGPATVTER